MIRMAGRKGVPGAMSRRGSGKPSGHHSLVGALEKRAAIRHVVAGELISVANLVGAPLVNRAGARVARINDIVVKWEASVEYPAVTHLLVRVGRTFALIGAADVELTQARVFLRADEELVSRPVRRPGDVALVRDVLDHQLVDVAGVQVVRAADVYLIRRDEVWELAGIDVSVGAFVRRLLHRRRHCPVPRRAIAWADVQHFSGSRHDEAFAGGPADGAGVVGSSLQARVPRSSLRRLRAAEIASLLQELGRDEGAQAVSLVSPATAAEALRSLNDRQRAALLAQLSTEDRERLESLMAGSP